MNLSITIPAYNEEVTLEGAVLDALGTAADVDQDSEVLIVDDGSTDGTAKIADRLAAEHPRVRVFRHESNRGFSGAMRSCMDEAAGDYVFLGPADGQARYEELDRFWPMRDRYDLIFSYRVARGDDARRKLSSTVWYAFLRILFGETIPEFSSTFLFRRDAIPEFPVNIRPDASNFLPILYLTAVRTGARVGTLGTVQHERVGGVAKGGSISNTARTVLEDLVLWWRLRVRPKR